MNLHEASEAIRAILDQIPDDVLPEPTRLEPDAKYGTCYWFGSHGYYAGSCRNGKGESIPSSFRRDALSDLWDRERMQRIENAYWAAKDGAA